MSPAELMQYNLQAFSLGGATALVFSDTDDDCVDDAKFRAGHLRYF